MELATHFQILVDAVCISFCANALAKGMDQFVIPPAMSK